MVFRHRVRRHIRRKRPIQSYLRGRGSRVVPFQGTYSGNPHLSNSHSSVPMIRKSLEYTVTLKDGQIIKIPNPGFEFKVESDYLRFQELGDLAPRTVYDSENNRLIQ